jgi:Domain of unknown function (DUF4349)
MKISILISLILAAGGCGGGNSSSTSVESASAPAMEKTAMMDVPATEQSEPSATVERKLIKTGQLNFETSDLANTRNSIESICKRYKAYIASENLTAYGDRQQHTLEIRVPANGYDSLTLTIEALALKVENKSTTVQDVTEEFIDVEARLKTKKELELRYLDLLKQAKKIEEMVAIEGQLANVRAEIESMEGRLKYLSNQVSYSTLNLSYYQVVTTDYGFFTKVTRGLGQGWKNLLDFIVILVNLWPFALIVAIVVWLAKRIKRSRNKQQP